MNLVVNARDAMPEGGTVTLRTSDAVVPPGGAAEAAGILPGAYTLLSVTDTGCGMDEAIRLRLFEPFFTTKEPGRGTGLGLATVHGIVTQSGGYIRVRSEEGKGTTFRIYFPRVEAEIVATEAAAAPTVLPRGNEVILVVEDSEEVRELTCRTLAMQGYRVLEAANGAEAIAVARRCPQPIRLLLTDVVMPGMSGRTLADALTAEMPGLAVAYTSGYTEDAIVRHGVLEPGIRFLPKPFLPSELAIFVRDVIGPDEEPAGNETA